MLRCSQKSVFKNLVIMCCKLFLLNTMRTKFITAFLILAIIKYSYRSFVFRNRKNGKAAEEEHSSSLNE